MRYLRLLRNISNWTLYLAVKFSLTSSDPLIFKAKNGIVLEVPRRLLHEFKEIFMEESYLRGISRPIPERPVIIDIGANAGFFTMFVASRFPRARILAYEPMEINFRQLQKNVNLNRGHYITCFNQAVSGESGTISLNFDPGDSFTTGATIFDRHNKSFNKIRVACVTIPEIFQTQNLEFCDFLKMDCEGAEYDILYNCPGNYLKRIFQMALEVHRGPYRGQDVHSLGHYLEEYGFFIRIIGPMLWAWRDTNEAKN